MIELDHFILEVSDPAAAARWFHERLGLEPVRLAEWQRGEVPFPSVRIGAATIIDLFPPRMWRASEAERQWREAASERNTTPRGATASNPNHLCFAMEPERFAAFRATADIVKSDDHNFGARGYGSSIYVAGPDGISVEVRTYFL